LLLLVLLGVGAAAAAVALSLAGTVAASRQVLSFNPFGMVMLAWFGRKSSNELCCWDVDVHTVKPERTQVLATNSTLRSAAYTLFGNGRLQLAAGLTTLGVVRRP
jgi:hypothetical protein